MTSQPGLLITDNVDQCTSAEIIGKLEGDVPNNVVQRATLPVETCDLITDVEAIITAGVTSELLSQAENLRWVHALSSGVEWFPLDELDKRGIALTNSAGVHAEPIAEHVLCFMLMFERGLHVTVRQQANSVWERVEGGELRGKTIGIIGVGAIGSRLAQLSSALGMTVLGTKRDLNDVPDSVEEIYDADEYRHVLQRSDYVAVTCPLTEKTRNLIGSKELEIMRRDAVLINIGRGKIVDEDALVLALQQKRIKGAGLDVFRTEPLAPDSPLWDLSNVVITPHTAGTTPYMVDRLIEIIRDNYRVLADGQLENLHNRII